MLQIVASLTDDSRGVIYDCNIFKIQATDLNGVSDFIFTILKFLILAILILDNQN
jgi:hypothetical protein